MSINQRETGQARLLIDSIALVSHAGFAEQRVDPIVDKLDDDVECPKMAGCTHPNWKDGKLPFAQSTKSDSHQPIGV